MQSVLNQSNLIKAESLGKNGTYDFNCWGGTLFVLDKIETLEWVCGTDMEKFLNTKTYIVKDREKGNILCLYLCGQLQHTAVYIDENRLWHKLGSNGSEYEIEELVKQCYEYDRIEIRKLK